MPAVLVNLNQEQRSKLSDLQNAQPTASLDEKTKQKPASPARRWLSAVALLALIVVLNYMSILYGLITSFIVLLWSLWTKKWHISIASGIGLVMSTGFFFVLLNSISDLGIE